MACSLVMISLRSYLISAQPNRGTQESWLELKAGERYLNGLAFSLHLSLYRFGNSYDRLGKTPTFLSGSLCPKAVSPSRTLPPPEHLCRGLSRPRRALVHWLRKIMSKSAIGAAHSPFHVSIAQILDFRGVLDRVNAWQP